MRPLLFEFGSVTVSSYGFFFALTYLAGSALLVVLGIRRRIPPTKLLGLVFWINFSAVIGSRALFALNNPDEFASFAEIFVISPGGFYFFGGLVLALVVLGIYIPANGLHAGEIADLVAAPAALGIVITKLGCHLAGCCYGAPTDSALGIRFPPGSLPWQAYGGAVSLHPTQLYTAAMGLAILAILVWRLPRRRFAGEVFLFLLFFFSLERAWNLTRRGDLGVDRLVGLPQSQVLGALFAVAALAAWVALSRRAVVGGGSSSKASG